MIKFDGRVGRRRTKNAEQNMFIRFEDHDDKSSDPESGWRRIKARNALVSNAEDIKPDRLILVSGLFALGGLALLKQSDQPDLIPMVEYLQSRFSNKFPKATHTTTAAG